jgi:SAM-dependent methyltransferase
MLEVLLARRGMAVTGVDLNAESLEFARGLLAQEPPEIGSRVELIAGDVLRTELPGAPFDTVVLGEVIEHLRDPATMIDRCLSLLRDGGRIIVTTPFGHLPHEDHEQAFGLSGFAALLKERCALEHLSVEDEYIRFVGRRSASGAESWRTLDARALLELSERATVAVQTRLHQHIDQLRRQRDSSRRKAELNLRKSEANKQRALRFQRTAAALRQSVRYRLGDILVRTARRPWRIWRVPIELAGLAWQIVARRCRRAQQAKAGGAAIAVAPQSAKTSR